LRSLESKRYRLMEMAADSFNLHPCLPSMLARRKHSDVYQGYLEINPDCAENGIGTQFGVIVFLGCPLHD